MNNTHPIPYEILLERYMEFQQEIGYLEYKISTLNDEIDAWITHLATTNCQI